MTLVMLTALLVTYFMEDCHQGTSGDKTMGSGPICSRWYLGIIGAIFTDENAWLYCNEFGESKL
jgi:hypothetical protein